jgi:hypothetical protein
VLSPSINDAESALTDAYVCLRRLSALSQTVSSLQITTLPDDPPWLAPVRDRIALLNEAGNSWMLAEPEMLAALFTTFLDYGPELQAVANLQTKPADAAAWIAVIEATLLPTLTANITRLQKLESGFHMHLASFTDKIPLLRQSIERGWSDLGEEEQKMEQLAAALVSLQDRVASLEADITVAGISGGEVLRLQRCVDGLRHLDHCLRVDPVPQLRHHRDHRWQDVVRHRRGHHRDRHDHGTGHPAASRGQ